MEKDFVCIVCPNGCSLHVSGEGGNLTVTGHKCKRGEAFAKAEVTSPMRTICSTVSTAFPDVPVLPVRVSADIPKKSIPDVMAQINKITVTKRVKRGEVIIANVLGLGADVIATSGILAENSEGGESK